MRYFKVNFSIGKDVGSVMPQANESSTVVSEINTINNSWLSKINESNIDFPSMILRKRAKKTDLISVSYLGYSSRLLISDKLKLILEKYQNENVQFFKTRIIYKDVEDSNYWVVHPYRVDYDFVDYSKSIINKQNILSTDPKEYVNIDSKEDFIKQRTHHGTDGKIWGFTIEKIVFKDKITDFFILDGVSSGIGYYVSEKLKNEIEEAGCTGIEFEPVGLT